MLRIGILLFTLLAAQGCHWEDRVDDSRGERLWSIEYSLRPEGPKPTLFTLYASGFIDLKYADSKNRPPLRNDWNRVEDLAAYQRVFDLAKDAIRTRPNPASGSRSDSGLTITVLTTEATYTFYEDILKLGSTPFPKCSPCTFEADGHRETWSALKSAPVIDTRLLH